jgi:glycosyltransferase involved in cell wall biosynthesis
VKIAIVSGDDLVDDDPQQLSSALAAHGHEVTACSRRRGGRPARASTDGYRAVAVSVGPRTAASASDVLPYMGDWAAKLERLWTSDQPDVVHAYGWLGGMAAQLAARRRGLPTVQTFLGLAAASHPDSGSVVGPVAQCESERMRIEPLLARGAAWVTGESSADVDALARLRHNRARVSAMPGGVDVERYTPSGPALTRADLHRIVCLAPNPLPCNGFDIAIGALPRVPGAELVIAETEATNRDHDEARAGLSRMATELGVADRVRFDGVVRGDDLPMLVRSADVVACTPREPPRATTVLQAMASGVAVVALPVGVLGDAVVDNVTGLVLSSQSARGLGAALRSLLAHSFQYKSMGAAGRNRALSRFAWDRIALDAQNIYRQVGTQRQAPAGLQSAGGW